MSAPGIAGGNDVRMSMQVHDGRWITYFRARGYPDAEPLATGMEGAVYRLGRGLVAKVWGAGRSHAELVTLQQFYADLGAQSLPFATPEMVELADVDGTSVTIERELSGRPLQEHLPDGGSAVPPAAQECLVAVLESLAATTDLASARALAVLSEPHPLRRDLDWPSAMVALLQRRVSAFGEQLRAAVDDFDAVHELISESLLTMERRPAAVVHGDLCGVNILVDEDLRPTAVLDWGFLTTAGDPAWAARGGGGHIEN
jgi:aminoglycoside phosphotransferase (APT) family kinase protein